MIRKVSLKQRKWRVSLNRHIARVEGAWWARQRSRWLWLPFVRSLVRMGKKSAYITPQCANEVLNSRGASRIRTDQHLSRNWAARKPFLVATLVNMKWKRFTNNVEGKQPVIIFLKCCDTAIFVLHRLVRGVAHETTMFRYTRVVSRLFQLEAHGVR